MARLHIDPEELRVTARRAALLAEEIDWQVRRMENARQTLQASWQGGGRFQFEAGMDHCLHTLRRLSREIVELSVRLQREAMRWEQIGLRF
jgi:WXG100 family type VII secretion target